jgi:hypothetical protein
MKRLIPGAALAAWVVLALSGTVLAAQATLTQISSDPFTNTTAVDGVAVYHATQVEPDTFAFGSTIVSAFQSGRFHDGGASDIGWATSTNGGKSWKHGFLPGLTFQVDPASPYERVSDASVAFDAKHGVWMISSIPITAGGVVPTVFVSRSSDGLHWSNPVSIPPTKGPVNLDKNWTVCDNTPTSPFFGNCYTELDNFAVFDLEELSTSSDGGATWGVPISTPLHAHGLGGQPLVQPNGNVVVPFESIDGLAKISAFGSTDGGAILTNAVNIATINFHSVAGDLRTSPLPTAEIDGAGKVYVAWEDCTFEAGCPANDIVFSSSSDGANWSSIARVPIAAVGSNLNDHFIPGLAVDNTTSGSTAHLGLSYYFYPNANCTVSTCQLDSGFISSSNGGATWGGQQQLAGPMSLTWTAFTTQGFMVGDYISTSFSGGLAFPVIAVAVAGTPTQNLNEATFATSSGLAVATTGTTAATTQGSGVGSSTRSFVVGPLNR